MKFEIKDTSGLGMQAKIKYIEEAGFETETIPGPFVGTYFVTISSLEELKKLAVVVRDPVSISHKENLLIIQDGYCRN